tara:strand:- start:831 stop:992 length:162 start_codon:yes stop_codon:yes gene_type:complete
MAKTGKHVIAQPKGLDYYPYLLIAIENFITFSMVEPRALLNFFDWASQNSLNL